MDYRFQRRRVDAIPELKLLEHLEKAAIHFHYCEFGWREFNDVADISANPVKLYFGSWKKGLAALKNHLQQKGLDLSPRLVAPNRIYSNEDLFNELERIWCLVGQRPSRNEWEASNPHISYNTYKQRFGGWTNACFKFIEYKMGDAISKDDFVFPNQEVSSNNRELHFHYQQETSRNVPLSLRFEVLRRDNYRCVFCGKSPVTNLGTNLHIDHKVPFSKGGKSTLDNLQTLCEECNLGKSDRI